jgi:hypothetical protein
MKRKLDLALRLCDRESGLYQFESLAYPEWLNSNDFDAGVVNRGGSDEASNENALSFVIHGERSWSSRNL